MNLVTGATGHIGNVLVRQLLARGQAVRVLVRPSRPLTALDGLNVELAWGDVLDFDSLPRALRDVKVVYHLAARVSLASGPDPLTERVNLDGTRNLLAALQATWGKGDGGRLVYVSSIYALRAPAEGVIDETLPFDPQAARGAYDYSKAAASLAVQQAAAEGLDAVIVCPTAVIGPYDFHGSESGRGIRYAMSPGVKFYVAGAYDFVDVRDVAQGCILAAERGRRGETYILGSERLSVRTVMEMVGEETGGWRVLVRIPDWLADCVAELAPLFSERPIVTPYSLAAVRSNSRICHAKAERELGFRPRPARQAIADSVRWYQYRTETAAGRAATLVEPAF